MNQARPGRIGTIAVHSCPLEQPGTGDSGGMNVYVRSLALALARKGVQSDIFTRLTHPDSPRVVIAAPGVRVFHIEAGPPRHLAKDEVHRLLPAFVAGIAEVAGKCVDRYSAIHSHYWLSSPPARLLSRRWGIPHVHTSHSLVLAKSTHQDRSAEPRFRITVETGAVRGADRLVASSRSEAEMLVRQYGAERSRLRVIYPGVDHRVFESPTRPARLRMRMEAGIGDAPLIVTAGRIQPSKGFDIAIRALDAVRRLGSPGEAIARTRLILLGGPSGPAGPSEARALVELAASLGLRDAVEFHEAVPQTELASYYAAADVVVVPSRAESFGLVALEAQACGTPVVVSDTGGLPETVKDGVTGFVHRVDDHRAIARSLSLLIRDVSLRTKMGRAAASRALEFSWGETAEAMCDVFGEDVGVRDDESAGDGVLGVLR